MNKQQARQTITALFEQPFEKKRFVEFVANLLNLSRDDMDERGPQRGAYIPENFKRHVSCYERIAKYSSSDIPDGLDVMLVNLKSDAALERARTMQRNFIARYLNGGRGGILRDAALVAYVPPAGQNWRLSLVTMDYQFQQTPSGRAKIQADFTPARRASFLVGEGEGSHTAQSRFVDWLAPDRAPTLAQLRECFDIETVTNAFYTQYRDLFIRVKGELDKIVESNAHLRADMQSKGVNMVGFAKKLMGQIVFLYFLQKKGWFGVKRGAAWGTGSKQFLRDLFSQHTADGRNFFKKVLEPLFYEALRLDRVHVDHYYSQFDSKIPFLNGGLFDPIGGYDWVNTDFNLPNALFSNSAETREGDGILDVFDRYNFTVCEDEPLEREVAVDPELMGKIYEKLNAIRPDNYAAFVKATANSQSESKFNKEYGVYYTPREIVYYMSQSGIVSYLVAKFAGKISRADIQKFVELAGRADEHEQTASQKQAQKARGEIKQSAYQHQMPQSIRDHAKAIDAALADIRVCDPAVGSGAFPLGIMSEIVRLRGALASGELDSARQYAFKRNCIERCIYGVDIDPGAAEIAKLRLWLSLVVDETNIGDIQPLPNLDYKIACGDSLSKLATIFNEEEMREIVSLKQQYLSATAPAEKEKLKQEIDARINKAAGADNKFEFTLHFYEVYNEKGGFDIVLGNPPYISFGLRGAQTLTAARKQYLKTEFPHSAEYKISIYAIFMEIAINLANDAGVCTYIVPDSFLLGRYFSKIRKYILHKKHIDALLLIKGRVFESAEVGQSVVYLLGDKANASDDITAIKINSLSELDRREYVSFQYPQNYFTRTVVNRFHLFFDQATFDIITKVDGRSAPLANFAKGYAGVIALGGQGGIVATAAENEHHHIGLISGGQIQKFAIVYEGHFINMNPAKIKSGGNHPSIMCKILVRQTADKITCAVDTEGYYHLNNTHSVCTVSGDLDIRFIAAVLNSTLLEFYYKAISLEEDRFMAQIDIDMLERLPMPKATHAEQKPAIQLVQEIMRQKASGNATADLEQQLNEEVYRLYNLTPSEIHTIQTALKKAD